MKDNLYLYGTDDVPEIPAHIIADRLMLLNHNLFEINKVSYLDRDMARRNDIAKAIKFWEEMRDDN